MAQWALSVAGIAILSVLCDVILPSGDTRKYVKTVLGVVVSLVLASPLIQFVGGDWSWQMDDELQLQQSFLDSVDAHRREQELSMLKSSLAAQDIYVNAYVNGDTLTVETSCAYSTWVQSAILSAAERCMSDCDVHIVWNTSTAAVMSVRAIENSE